jgi:hypothetical protein
MTRNTRLCVIPQPSVAMAYALSAALLTAVLLFSPGWAATALAAAGNQHDQPNAAMAPHHEEDELTPEQKMQKRFPQPVRVGDLIGLPVLDFDDATIGYIRQVVRSPDGKVFLIVPYSAWFGWARTERGKRPVAVPIAVVAILGRQLDALEWDRSDFDEAPTWTSSQGRQIPPNDKVLVALGRR